MEANELIMSYINHAKNVDRIMNENSTPSAFPSASGGSPAPVDVHANTCPDCQGGEHHPKHDVSIITNHGTAWCICPCATIMTRATPPLPNGTAVRITAGRFAGKIGGIVGNTDTMSTYMVEIPALKKIQYVPVEWVETVEK